MPTGSGSDCRGNLCIGPPRPHGLNPLLKGLIHSLENLLLTPGGTPTEHCPAHIRIISVPADPNINENQIAISDHLIGRKAAWRRHTLPGGYKRRYMGVFPTQSEQSSHGLSSNLTFPHPIVYSCNGRGNHCVGDSWLPPPRPGVPQEA